MTIKVLKDNLYQRYNKEITLFFTRGYSLKTWDQAGLLSRDIQLYSELSKLDIRSIFITYGREDEKEFLPKNEGFEVFTQPNRFSNFAFQFLSPIIHRKAVRSSDVIKTHQIQGAISGIVSKILFRKPYIARCGYLKSVFAVLEKDLWKHRVKYTIEEFLAFRFADIVCIPSSAEAAYAAKRYRIPVEKFHVCPNWIDTNLFTPNMKKKEPFTIIFVARFVEKKGPDILLEAIKGIEHLKLIMVGDGPMKESLVQQSKKNRLNVEFYGHIQNLDIPKYLQRSAVYVLPTHHEGGSPKTILEAMSCGLPVISTDGFGVDEVFDEGVHGLKVKFGDVIGLRQAIIQIIENPSQAEHMGNNGRQHVIENYSVEKAVERELKIIEKLT